MPDKGLRFITTNTDDNTHGQNGELWYKEILFTDIFEEASRSCDETNTYSALIGSTVNKFAQTLEDLSKIMENESGIYG